MAESLPWALRTPDRGEEKFATEYVQRHRLPLDIICYAVSLYDRFALRFLDIDDLVAERSVIRVLREGSPLIDERKLRLAARENGVTAFSYTLPATSV